MSQLRRGSDAAVWELIERYEPHIRRVVRRRLHGRLRSKFDSMDFVQMVWTSFFRTPREMQSFHAPEQLVGYLVQMAKYKVEDERRRRLQTQKYDVTKEEPLEEREVGASDCHQPSDIAIARERWERLLEGRTERVRNIVRLRIEGLTFQQIGDALDIHESTARKAIADLLAEADQLDERYDTDDPTVR